MPSIELFNKRPKTFQEIYKAMMVLQKGTLNQILKLVHTFGCPLNPRYKPDSHRNMHPQLRPQGKNSSASGSDPVSSMDLTLTIALTLARPPRSEESMNFRPMTSAKLFREQYRRSPCCCHGWNKTTKGDLDTNTKTRPHNRSTLEPNLKLDLLHSIHPQFSPRGRSWNG